MLSQAFPGLDSVSQKFVVEEFQKGQSGLSWTYHGHTAAAQEYVD
jgi:hypothetical protein